MTAPLALVAGASRGLGLQLAIELAQQGYRLVLCARDGGSLERAADRLRTDGYDVTSVVCDVGDAEAVDAMVAHTEASVGPVEVLLCVAGTIQVGPLPALRREHFEAAVATMLWGPVNLALALAPRMRDRGHGRIGVVSSVGGLASVPHLLPYSTAKFGAVGFSRGLRSELAGSGVTVTTVTPGLMRTGSHLRAQFVGDQAAEYSWFAPAASLPLLSMDVERAARRIVAGVLAGRAVVQLTPLAVLAPRVDALAPGLTAALLGLTHRLLPDPPADGDGTSVEGWQAARRLPARRRLLLDRLTVLGRRAAVRLNELPSGRR